MKEWKIYTKTGDSGETSLLGGKRVPKYHPRIEAYGTIDELNSFVGLLRDQDIAPRYKDLLFEIQDRLFTAESLIAADKGSENFPLPNLSQEDISLLEQEIDRMNESLPALSNFILPGGHQAVSMAHVCRTVCRRAERHIILLATNHLVDDIIIRYFNRLSDYFFVLARKIALDLDIPDQVWKARK
ncbi:MAG: cob(I)yrinic acid a,c-diamide adenosyltransferase [Bacteroidales bacterium]|jgi:cob(I)alamin adenosyltransferase|nr:cob(I)yrinic acid a,c-diamide adenosyltransferase [Bacteroidales bacterium]NLM93847.1 cob(I)yrinic acid a,c-diamide adenosyltransferase [Bacteroidales bacterium]